MEYVNRHVLCTETRLGLQEIEDSGGMVYKEDEVTCIRQNLHCTTAWQLQVHFFMGTLVELVNYAVIVFL